MGKNIPKTSDVICECSLTWNFALFVASLNKKNAKFRVYSSGVLNKPEQYLTRPSFKMPLTQTNLQVGSCLPGKLDKGMPFALKGVSQLGSWIKDLFCATVATMFHSHLEWQSQCNGFPSI